MTTPSSALRHLAPVALIAASLAFCVPVHADSNSYQVRNLVSDPGSGISTPNHDANLKNGWGVAFNPTGFVWVAANHAGDATLYDGNGVVQSLVVKIPSAGATGDGSPTGIVFNASNDFVVTARGVMGPSRFIFASEDGMISGWAPTVDGTHAIKGWVNANASYKGLALAGTGENLFLYAADFRNGKIDVYDKAFHPVTLPAGKFRDNQIPSNYAPFNIQNILGDLYVAYAKKDPASDEELTGPGFGFVDVYDASGNLLRRLARHGTLNAPWGLALAPTGFGRFSNRVLVGNFGDGTLNAYDPHTGEFKGQLRNKDGKLIKIDGLWGIAFGNGIQHQPTSTLFFAAGPNDEVNGLYGRIDAVSSPGDDNEDDDEDDDHDD